MAVLFGWWHSALIAVALNEMPMNYPIVPSDSRSNVIGFSSSLFSTVPKHNAVIPFVICIETQTVYTNSVVYVAQTQTAEQRVDLICLFFSPHHSDL